MPYTGINWPNTDTESRRPYMYDFENRIPAGDPIASVVWELTVQRNSIYTGLDPAPSPHVELGTAVFDTNTCTVWVSGLLANVRYQLTAFITTAGGIKDDLYSYISCDLKPQP